MSVNNELKVTNNSNEWTNWIDEAVSKNYFKHYEYKHFSNVQEIGSGGFGKVYRAYWKNSNKYLALKSFFNLNNATVKEIVQELKLQREVDFHENIIRFYGITTSNQENQNDQLKQYLLVLEYADGGTLQSYLKEHFDNLTWGDKFDLALQLAYAVSCLHDEGIVHRDLHSNNVLIHQNIVKLADFGLSKRIEEASNIQSKLFGIIPYVDPKVFSRPRKTNNQIKVYSLNEKSDVYSVGILLWEISSGQPPFYTDSNSYDVGLALEIVQGLRETAIPDTPENYIKVYTECWDSEPENRPTMKQVVDKLKELTAKTNVIAGNDKVNNYKSNPQPQNQQNFNSDIVGASSSINNSLNGELSQVMQNLSELDTKIILESLTTPNEREFNSNVIGTSSSINDPLHGNLSRVIQNFNELDTKNILESLTTQSMQIINKNNLPKNDFNEIIDEMVNLFNNLDEDKVKAKAHILTYLNDHNINPQEIYNWLLNNQNNSDSIILFGNFNYLGIGVSVNKQKAFELYQKAAKFGNHIGQHNLAKMYKYGEGIDKDDNEAFELFKKSTDGNFSEGILELGNCYYNGIGTSVNKLRAIELYRKAASLGNHEAQYILAKMHTNGEEVDKDYNQAFKFYQKSAEGDYLEGILALGNCYYNGNGTNVNKQKAFESYRKAANLGNHKAQYIVAYMFENGEGVRKDYKQAFEFYKRSADGNFSEGVLILGYFYDNGIGTNVDKQKAFELYQKAANLDNFKAQHNLARMYENGEGTTEDIDRAIYWYQKSFANGNNDAVINIRKLTKRKKRKNKSFCNLS